MHALLTLASIGMLAVAGCGDDSPSPSDTGADTDGSTDADAAVETGASATFAPPASGELDWGQAPFPGDLFIGDDGMLAIAALPESSPDAAPTWEAVRGLLSERDGFCMTCGVHFPIEGDIDAASLPPRPARGAAGSPSDSIVFVDVDAGALIPVRTEWNAVDDEISVRPVRGVTLQPGGRYVVALTDAILAEDGTALEPSAVFAALRDGGASTPEAERARAMVDAALGALSAAGVERARVVAATAYDVWDPRSDVRTLRELVHASAVPEAVFDDARHRVWVGAELDAIYGIPAEDRPGVDVAPMAGTEGVSAIVHSNIAVVITGSFSAPRVVEGDADSVDVGVLRRGADGRPEAGPAQVVPFTLAVPAGADLTRLPVLVYQTGLGDHRQLPLAFADTACAAGVALLSIEAFLQGERAASAIDERHVLRDSVDTPLGPDGMFEHDSTDVNARLLATHADASPLAFPGYMLGSLAQQVADVFAAIRFARQGDLSALASASPSLAGLAFDRDRVYFGGGTQGAAIGAVALAIEPDAAGALLYTPWASWIEVFAESTPMRLRGGANALFLVLGAGLIDEVRSSMVMHPLVDFYRFVIEPIEPLVFARHLYSSPLVTPQPDMLIQLPRHDEFITPPTSESWLAAAQIPGFGDFTFAQVPLVAPPVSANLDVAGDALTVAAAQTDADHFALLRSTDTRNVEEPLEPPFVPLAEQITVAQPIVQMNQQITHFLSTSVSDSAEICAVGDCP